MLDLGEGDVMEELDEELAGDVLLVGGKSFDSNENGGEGDGKDIEGMDVGYQK